MNWALYAVAGVLAVAALFVVAGIGKTDKVKATTGGQAAAVVVVNAAMIVVVVLAALRLS